MDEPAACFLTAHTHGTRLHGDAAGSVDAEHATPGTPFYRRNDARARYERSLLKHPPVRLDRGRRRTVQARVRAVCAHRG